MATVDPGLVSEVVRAAREAVSRRNWAEAHRLLSDADSTGGLDGDGLAMLASTAFASGSVHDALEAQARAYAAHLAEGNSRAAGRMACELYSDHGRRGETSVAAGWLRRAEHALQGDEDCAAYGHLTIRHAVGAHKRGDIEQADELMARALDLGRRHADADLAFYAMHYQGLWLIRRGQVDEGLALLEEAALAAVNRETGPWITGLIYCNVIATCRDLGDWERAAEWTEVADRWTCSDNVAPFPGVCRIHRAELKRMRGAWAEAEREALSGWADLIEVSRLMAAAGLCEAGEVRLRLGDLDGAEDAFRRAHELGHEAQPGRALLALARGEPAAAMSALDRGLAQQSDQLERMRLLGPAVEIAIAAGNLDAARAASAELDRAVETFSSAAWQAIRDQAAGRVLLATGSAEDAARALHRSVTTFCTLGIPYEAAQTRVLLGQALADLGQVSEAIEEWQTARRSFAELGAARDERRVTALIASSGGGSPPAIERATRAFMFTDIVDSTRLIEAIGDEAWAHVITWHDREARECVARHGGEELDDAGDGFLFCFSTAADAL
ncbi:MAG: hypothetical protein E6J14_00175, partial [Chloroflexi bacterium]